MMLDISLGVFECNDFIFIKCILSDYNFFNKLLSNNLYLRSVRIENENVWIAPINRYNEIIDRLQVENVSVHKIPVQLLSLFLNDTLEKIDFCKLSELKSYKKLSEYQKNSVKFMISKRGRAMNASEMGTGKTATAICVSEYYNDLQPQLIICPSGLKQNWKNEYNAFAEKNVHLVKNCRDSYTDTVNIISYSLLSTSKVKVKSYFQVLILDESHYIKNRFSKRFKVISRMAKIAKKVILLSGTPNSKSSELYTQLFVMDPTVFGNFFCFKPDRKKHDKLCFACRYCNPTKVYLGKGKFGYKFDGNMKPWELFALSKKYITRVKKETVLSLPEKSRCTIMFDTMSQELEQMFNTKLTIIEKLRNEKGSKAAEYKLMELVRKTATLKQHIVEYYVRQVLERHDNKKYLFFAHHKFLLQCIKNQLDKSKKKYIYIDGSTKPEIRQKNVDLFQHDQLNINYAVLSIKAAGTGLNLYKGHVVVFFELLWSEKDMIQAEDRVHRRNVQHSVLIEYIVLKKSTDDIILRTLRKKYKTVSMILDNKSLHLHFNKQVTHT